MSNCSSCANSCCSCNPRYRRACAGSRPSCAKAEPEIEPLEVAERTREQDDALTFSQHDRELLSDVNYALRKIEDGSYGISEASGDPIPFERLHAVPWARTDTDEV